MGGSGSTRRVVVEDARGEDVVTISEAVVRRLQGQPEAYEAIPETKPTAPPQFFKPETFESKSSSLLTKDEEDFFTQKLQELQQRNAALQKLTNEEFAKAVQEVEEKFVKTTSSPICQDLQLKVIECYQANPTEVLNCASVVDAFTTCVERARTVASFNRTKNITSG
ncbi:MICOS complex subunit MIC19-like isoform X2 [Biomphalaria pfeifferi]|uniref:MICOS complex subunit MIC19-like isoform X2 n=1 Tax=Biomphalaria pfeifferi TaxID=112525 RepID=A0AAD8F722_BIOPF|nr:MICOS complex subunit MIC19-like isoform X2 [Biomphalaria pfeifferi]